MRINHNIAALNTYSRLSQATTAQAKSLEKLSSGQRINKAGDDAAGLAISEKMRSQIRGLGQASRNAQDGISMIQTAEGALGETHSILQRMRELAVQAGNDTNTTSDRGEIQKEVNQLSGEINRIAGTTEFNKQTLLDGGAAAGSVKGISVGITKAGNDDTQAKFTYEFSCAIQFTAGCTITLATGCALNANCTFGATLSGSVAQLAGIINTQSTGWKAEAVGGKLTITAVVSCTTDGTVGNCVAGIAFSSTALCTGAANCYTMTSVAAVGACALVSQITFTDSGVKEGVIIASGNCSVGLYNSSSGTYSSAADAMQKLKVDTVVDILCGGGVTMCAKDLVCTLLTNTSLDTNNLICKVGDYTLKITTDCAAGTKSASENAVSVTAGTGSGSGTNAGFTLQIGANTNQTFNVSFEDMTGKGVKITSELSSDSLTTSSGAVATFTSTITVENNGVTNQYSLDVSDAAKATNAVSAIDDAITKVSSERSKLGAYQNRLEHTIANLDTSSENLTGAESRIRDVDMAKEMMEFTKNNILNQAATAMLAQANQQPQGVLQLLR